MAVNPVNPPMPADLPTNWTYGQTVAPTGAEAGLDEKHGYNYLMQQVNAAQSMINQVGAAIAAMTAADVEAVPNTRTVNGKALSADVALSAADVQARPASWTPTAADVGALPSGGTAAAATKLATARTIRTNLASPSAASFNGTANVTPGVTGTLPLANGGTGATSAAAARTNLGVGPGKRVARFTVGTSAAGWTAADVDYLCDGTADQVEINAAIQALPSIGGEVVILDGTYNLTASILVNKTAVTLSGNGESTILKRAFAGTSDTTMKGLINVSSSYNTIRFLSLSGEKSIYSGQYNFGLYIYNSNNNTIIGNTFGYCYDGIYLIGNQNKIYNNTITSNSSYGIHVEGKSDKNSIICNTLVGDAYGSIFINTVTTNSIIASNVCITNYGSCISLGTSSNYNSIVGNVLENGSNGIYLHGNDMNIIIGNICKNNNNGISLSNSGSNTIAGNSCVNFGSDGIILSLESVHNVIVGNYCSNLTGGSYTIRIKDSSGANNLIADNFIMSKNYTNSGTNNTFVNNKYS